MPQDFFQVGRSYRVSTLLSFTDQKSNCLKTYCLCPPLPPILYKLRLDPCSEGVCFIDCTNIKWEREFLLLPFCFVFTVVSVRWEDNPTLRQPHRVELRGRRRREEEQEKEEGGFALAPWH